VDLIIQMPTRGQEALLRYLLRRWSTNASQQRAERGRLARDFDGRIASLRTTQTRGPSTRSKSAGRTTRRKTRRFKKKGRKTGGLTRRRILNLITVPNWWVQEIGDNIVITTASSTIGAGTTYFTSTGPINGGGVAMAHHMTTYDLTTLFRVAGQIQATGTVAQNIKYFVPKVVLRYRLINHSNGYVNCTAYYCMFRTDIPAEEGYQDLVDQMLREGFTQAGAPNGQFQDELTPFQATGFVELVKIQRVRKFKIEAGQQWSISLKESRMRQFNLAKYFVSNSTEIWENVVPDYEFCRGSRFILFKFTGQPATNITGGGFTFTSPRVLCHTIHRLQYKTIFDDRVNVTTTPAIGIATGVDPRIITEDTDLVTPFQNA